MSVLLCGKAKFWFAGLVGAGRSETMQTLFGFRPRTNGKAILAGKPWVFNDTHHSVSNGFIYLSEERTLHGILPYLSPTGLSPCTPAYSPGNSRQIPARAKPSCER